MIMPMNIDRYAPNPRINPKFQRIRHKAAALPCPEDTSSAAYFNPKGTMTNIAAPTTINHTPAMILPLYFREIITPSFLYKTYPLS